MASVLRFKGQFDLAQDRLARSVEVRDAIGDQVGLVQSLFLLSEIHALMGDWQSAVDATDRALMISEEIQHADYILQGKIRRQLNRLSSGYKVDVEDLDSLKPESKKQTENMVLWYTLVCRNAQISGGELSRDLEEGMLQFAELLFTMMTTHMLCLLTASVASHATDRNSIVDLLERVIAYPQIPPGAPLDMVLSARALLESPDSPERDEWEARAMAAVARST